MPRASACAIACSFASLERNCALSLSLLMKQCSMISDGMCAS